MTTVNATTVIALAATVIALVAASAQVAMWWRGRHHVSVSCLSGGRAIPNQGSNWDSLLFPSVVHSMVGVTVRNVGRDASVERITFHLVPGTAPTKAQGLKCGEPSAEALQDLPPYCPLPQASGSELLRDGESRTWRITLELSPPEKLSVMQSDAPSFEAYARVDLSTGQHVVSAPFRHAQSPPEGWPKV